MNTLMNSSSGGAFTAISDYIIEANGVVIAPVYNYKSNRMEYRVARNKDERNMMRGSKYIQTCRNDFVFSKVLAAARDRKVLFVGTPCYVEGLKKYLEAKSANMANILLVDIICHGVASPMVWSDYLAEKGIKQIEYLTFKDKKFGWSKPSAYVCKKKRKIMIDDYVSIYYSGNVLRPSCHVCPYASLVRPGDITIGDCWGVKEHKPSFASENGVSLLIVSTQKGLEIANIIRRDMTMVECEAAEILQPNLQRPTPCSPDRDKFWNLYKECGLLCASRSCFLVDSDLKYKFRRLKMRIKHFLRYEP